MTDQDKSKQQLIEELTELRQRVATSEAVEDELRKNRALLQATIDNLPFDFFAVGMNGRYMLQNATSKAHWGDVVGKRPKDAAENKETLVLWEENNRRALAGEKVEEDVTVTIKGEKRCYHNVIAPIINAGQTQGILGMNVDITERKRAEEVLRESERRFRSLFQDSSVGTAVVTPNGQFIQVNRAFCDFLGYSEPEIVGQTVLYITHPEDREATSTAIRRAAELGPPIQRLEKRYFHKSGQVLWGEVSSTLVCDADGKPGYFITQVLDISKRKQAEAELRNSERTLRTLIDTSPESILLLDTAGTVLIVNETAARRLCTTVHAMVGQKTGTFVPAEVAVRRMKHLQEVIQTGKAIRFEDQRSGRHFEIAMHPVFDEQEKVAAVAILSIDRTDRKRAEEALKKSHDELERRVEERTAELTKANEELAVFRRFVEASNQGFGMAKLNGEMTYVNPAISRLFPDRRPEDIVGKHVSTIYSEEYMHEREKQILPSVLREGHWQGEVAISYPGGTMLVLQNSFLVRDEQGNPTYLATVLTDITERKRAEEALQQAHDELRAIYNGIVEGLVITDIETKRFVRVNSSLCRMLGYSEKELLAASISDIHPPEEVPEDLQRFQAIAEGRASVQQDRPVLRKDGSVFCADITGHTIVYEGRPSLLAFFHDVTERKRAEAALQQSRDELQAIYNQIKDGIAIVDAEKERIVHVNSAFCRMVAYSEVEIMTISTARLHPTETHPIALKHFETVKKGMVARSENVPFLRKDGGVVYADVISSPISYNERSCWISFFHDVTERKRAEEALQKEHRTLKYLLQSSDHERQLIAYEIHDGLAQQLAGAIMQLQTYFHQKETNLKLAVKAYDAGMTMLQQGHFEARRLIAGVRPPILDESGVVAAVGHLVNEQGRLKGPKIEYRSRVDFDRLAPILENATYRIVQEGLTNACQHSKSEKVRVSLVQRGDRIRIEIRDWGIGFDTKSVQENRFGLVGIRQRARLLGGKCSIRSTAGKGTRITVELPVIVRQ